MSITSKCICDAKTKTKLVRVSNKYVLQLRQIKFTQTRI